MVPNEETTSLVLECFCTRGDNIWEMSDDDIARQCVKDLENKLGLVKPGEVVDGKVVRALQAYPVYDLDYAPKIELVKEYLNQFEGLYIVGRGGTHRYNNADHSIEMGLLLYRSLAGLRGGLPGSEHRAGLSGNRIRRRTQKGCLPG